MKDKIMMIFKISIEKKENLKELARYKEQSSAQILRDLIDKEYKKYQEVIHSSRVA